uniref:Uncharacterized protein n=1 Tax=Mycena chlorophos TaxID=658473 RepID=A0ABQ0L3X7_MYCCL|nr:predicted protein [Mycena chlorophos]
MADTNPEGVSRALSPANPRIMYLRKSGTSFGSTRTRALESSWSIRLVLLEIFGDMPLPVVLGPATYSTHCGEGCIARRKLKPAPAFARSV